MTTGSDDKPQTERVAERVGDRIAKLLARAGVASRREIERMIADGRIALDGATLDTPATVLRSLRGVTVDGNPVEAATAARLFLYHKPPGLLVTERDPAGRPTIYDRLPRDLPRLVPVGRLDLATEGLLLLTSDGGLKRQLELPATGVERVYRARAYGPVTQGQLEDLMEGVEIEGLRYGPIDANLERRTGANQWIELTLTEGKNREVRRVLEYLGLSVSRLIRTRYGPFVLADLAPGEVGEVRQNDLVAFRQTLDGRKRGDPTDPQRVAVTPPRAVAKPARPPSAPAVDRRRPLTQEPDRALRQPRPVRPARPAAAAGDAPASPAANGRRMTLRAEQTGGRSSRPARFREDARPERPARPTDRTAAPGAAGPGKPSRPTAKGPAGGRGHPPRAPKGGKR